MLRPAFRFSQGRQAYVLRLAGDRVGPVLRSRVPAPRASDVARLGVSELGEDDQRLVGCFAAELRVGLGGALEELRVGGRPSQEARDVIAVVVAGDASWRVRRRSLAALATAAGREGLVERAEQVSLYVRARGWRPDDEPRSSPLAEELRDAGVVLEGNRPRGQRASR